MSRRLASSIGVATAAIVISACGSGSARDSIASSSPQPRTYAADIPWMESQLALQVDARFHVHGTVVRCVRREDRWAVGGTLTCPIMVPGAKNGYAIFRLINPDGRWSWTIANQGAYARH